MERIVEEISKIPKMFHAKGCSDEQVKEAEKTLKIIFPKEFVAYVKEYGAISFFATEWTGLNVGERINVVDVTKKERELNSAFPKDCFVLENQAIDGIITIVDSEGKVFALQHDKKVLLCDTILEYLKNCINRK